MIVNDKTTRSFHAPGCEAVLAYARILDDLKMWNGVLV